MAGELKETIPDREAKEMSLANPPDSRPGAPAKQARAEKDERPSLEADLDDNQTAGEHNAEAKGPAEVKSGGRSLARKAVLYTLPALCLVAIASVLLVKSEAVGKFFGNPLKVSPQNLEPVTSITRPVPVPDHREMLDFFILNEAEGQKIITAFRMEVAFSSPSRYRNFKEQSVTFRDTVYSFLQAQNSSRNTSHSWQTVVEKSLFDFIRAKLPESRPDTMRLTQVENL